MYFETEIINDKWWRRGGGGDFSDSYWKVHSFVRTLVRSHIRSFDSVECFRVGQFWLMVACFRNSLGSMPVCERESMSSSVNTDGHAIKRTRTCMQPPHASKMTTCNHWCRSQSQGLGGKMWNHAIYRYWLCTVSTLPLWKLHFIIGKRETTQYSILTMLCFHISGNYILWLKKWNRAIFHVDYAMFPLYISGNELFYDWKSGSTQYSILTMHCFHSTYLEMAVILLWLKKWNHAIFHIDNAVSTLHLWKYILWLTVLVALYISGNYILWLKKWNHAIFDIDYALFPFCISGNYILWLTVLAALSVSHLAQNCEAEVMVTYTVYNFQEMKYFC